MPSLTVEADQASVAPGTEPVLEAPEDQNKDNVHSKVLKPSDDGGALSQIIHKDAKGQNGSHPSRQELTAAPQRKNVKNQNGVKHQPKSTKGSNAPITAPKKSSYHSKRDLQLHQQTSDLVIPSNSEGAVQKPVKEENFREHGSEAVKSQEESTSEHPQEYPSDNASQVVVIDGERLENSCSLAQMENPLQSSVDQALGQTVKKADAREESVQDTIQVSSSQIRTGQVSSCSSQVIDVYSLKDPNFSETVAAAQPPPSPHKSTAEKKADQPGTTSLNNLTNFLDAPSKPLKSAVEKSVEKKTTHKGLKRAVEKPPRISSSDPHSPAKTPTSLSPSQKSVPVIQPEKSPKTPPQTPPKSISPMKASKVSPESAGSEGSEEKEDNQKALKKASEKLPRKSLVPILKSRKSRLGQKGTTANEQQGSEDGNTHNGTPAISSKQQVAQPSGLGKGQLLLKMAKLSYASGDNPNKALEHATRAVKFFESNAGNSSCLELVMSMHILAAVHCTLGQYEEAISILQRSLALVNSESKSSEGTPDTSARTESMLALFSGHMQLGDTFVLIGMHEKALDSYHTALEVQKQALGDMDPLVGDTCRYLSEAHLQFKEAEEMCQHVLKIHSENSSHGSVEEAIDRRLMALILSAKGEHETALEHLVFASTALSSNSKEVEVAAVDCCIGDAYVALGRYDEAVFAYQKALSVFKSVKGEAHASVASIYISLAEVSLKTGKQREAKSYGDNALRIYGKHGARHALDELAIGLTEVAAVYETINEREQALCLLQRALDILEKAPGEHNAAAGVEAQMGVLYFVMGKPSNSFRAFKNAVLKLRAGSEKDTALVGVLLNQMGLACVELHELAYATEVFQEAQSILEEACGPHHPDTLAVCSNLAGVYDALGRVDDAISILETILEVKEERLGTVHRDVEDERQRLMELLREVGRPRVRKTNTLEQLLTLPVAGSRRYEGKQR
ncbi:hypothetical protein O6H91_18G066300 [Diphasiastrum complanatum]|uniref:Uncharacterized protein n=1 Tax=Diphasiastrum complanatum TaxID=34168 RepID=A0ACC2B277_DIPCM|nr:hypothetical protein O6H91_18G066300 [Diphasiastrum complanatum]